MSNEDKVDYSQDLEQVQTFNAKCPNCGSVMVFDPDTQGLKCEHCGSTVAIVKNFEEIENDITKGFAEAEKWSVDEQVTYKCQNCGAVVVLSSDEEASICPFCQTTHVAKEGTFDGIRPHMVIPFQLGAEVASQRLKNGLKVGFLLPANSKRAFQYIKLKGYTSLVLPLIAILFLLTKVGLAIGIRELSARAKTEGRKLTSFTVT